MSDFAKTVRSIGSLFKAIDKPSTDSFKETVQDRVAEMINENTIDEAKVNHPIPGLQKWSMYGSGTTESHGRHSYVMHLDDAEEKYKDLPSAHTIYTINASDSSSGHPKGYRVIAWSPRAGHSHKFLGSVSHPAQGVDLARKHYDNFLAPKKSVDENMVQESDGTKTYSVNGKTYQGFKTKEARDAEFKRRQDKGDQLLRKVHLAKPDKGVTHPYLLTLESYDEVVDPTHDEFVSALKKHSGLHKMVGDKPEVDSEKARGRFEHHVHDLHGNAVISHLKDDKGNHRVVMNWRNPANNTIEGSQVVHVSPDIHLALDNAHKEYTRRSEVRSESEIVTEANGSPKQRNAVVDGKKDMLVELSNRVLRNYADKATYDYGKKRAVFEARNISRLTKHDDAEYDELKKHGHKMLNRYTGITKAIGKLADRAESKESK